MISLTPNFFKLIAGDDDSCASAVNCFLLLAEETTEELTKFVAPVRTVVSQHPIIAEYFDLPNGISIISNLDVTDTLSPTFRKRVTMQTLSTLSEVSHLCPHDGAELKYLLGQIKEIMRSSVSLFRCGLNVIRAEGCTTMESGFRVASRQQQSHGQNRIPPVSHCKRRGPGIVCLQAMPKLAVDVSEIIEDIANDCSFVFDL